MAIQQVNRAHALLPGCDLWIVPDEENDPRLKKVDWYLNFQLSRAKAHRPQKISSALETIAKENEITPFQYLEAEEKPLLVVAHDRLPTELVVQIKKSKKHLEWIHAAQKSWEAFNKPSVRIFLPEEITLEEFKSSWPQSTTQNISVVISLRT